jgi:hypothetical protein
MVHIDNVHNGVGKYGDLFSRVSTRDQELVAQISGAKTDRPELAEVIG